MFDNMQNVVAFLRETNAPEIIFSELKKCVGLPERTDFHPEGTTDRHIEIVFNRVMQYDSLDLELLASAILHDIKKPQSGSLKERDGMSWWSNPSHAQEAFDFIHDNDDVMDWLQDIGADPVLTARICQDHMRMKPFLKGEQGEKGEMKESKRNAMMEDWGEDFFLLRLFSKMDDMLLDWDEEMKKL